MMRRSAPSSRCPAVAMSLLALAAALLLVTAVGRASWPSPAGPATGNRVAPGRGAFPKMLALRLALPDVRWIVSPGPYQLAAIDVRGTLTMIAVRDGTIRAMASHAALGAPDAAPVAVRPGGGPLGVAFVTHDLKLATWNGTAVRVDDVGSALSPLTHPTAVDLDGNGVDELLAIGRDGALVLLRDLRDGAHVVARAAIGALPDARISIGPDHEAVVLTGPTERYAHGALGDRVDAGALTAVTVGPRSLTTRGRWRLPQSSVLEDQRVVLADIDGDGRLSALVTRSLLERGATVLALTRSEGLWAIHAEGAPVGEPFRWQHVLGAADLDGDGAVEIVSVRTPHMGGVLQAWRRRGPVLERVAAFPGVASHALNSRNLDQAAIADLDGSGRPEVIVPAQARDELLGVELASGGFQRRWSYKLAAPIASNVVVTDLDGDGKLDLAVADERGVVVLLSR